MSLTTEERTLIVSMEIEKAWRIFSESDVYVQNELWSTLANRLYYAAFHAATALLIHNGLRAGTHQGVHVLLSKHFVKEGILSIEEGTTFSRLQTMRERGDYNCLIDTTKEEILPFVDKVKFFIDKIESLIKS